MTTAPPPPEKCRSICACLTCGWMQWSMTSPVLPSLMPFAKVKKNPETLAALRNGNCRKSATETAKALHSNGRTDYLFALHCTKNMIFTNPFNKKYNSVVPPLKNSSRVLSTPMKIKKS
ncbi:MAG: hypothetical protein ACOYU6_04890 [Bacteroidota bacterium]